MSDLTIATEIRDAAKAAYLKALAQGSNYSVNSGNASRSKTNYNLVELRKEYERAQAEVDRLSNGTSRRTKFITTRNY